MTTTVDGRPYQIAVYASPDRDSDGILIAGFPDAYLTDAIATAPIRLLGTTTAAAAAWTVTVGTNDITLSLPKADVAAIGLGHFEWVLLLQTDSGSQPSIVGGTLNVSYSTKRTSGVSSATVTIDPIGADVTITQVIVSTGGAVDSVNGQTGVVVLGASDVSAQPVDSDLTAIAALTTTAYGRAFLALADAAAGRTALGLGTAATTAATAYDVTGAAAAAQAASQPLDSDLTAIAALTTTSFGRAFLALADAAAARTALTLGTAAVVDTGTGGANVPTVTQADARYQPLDSDLTAIAALTTTSYGRALLAAANLAALQAILGTTGTPSASTFLRGDGSWNTPAGGAVASDVIWDTKGDLAAATGADTGAKLAVGNPGQIIVPNSNASTGLQWAGPLVRPPTTGQYMSSVFGWGTGTHSFLDLNRIYYIPFWVPQRAAFDRIASSLNTVGSAGAVLRMGIYSATAAGAPGSLVIDGGTVAADAGTGLKTVTINQTLDPGLYFIATGMQVAITSAIMNRYAAFLPFLGPWDTAGATVLTASGQNMIYETQSGALPGTATPLWSTSGNYPWAVALRAT